MNIDYLRTKLNELLRVNDQLVIPDNETLVSKTVCSSDDINCIESLCKNCSVNMMTEIANTIQYCSYDCKDKQAECSSHTIVFHQFKKGEYTNKKGEVKKNCLLLQKGVQ